MNNVLIKVILLNYTLAYCNTASHEKNFQIFVVYHTMPNEKNAHWKQLIFEQLDSVRKSGLFDIDLEFHLSLNVGNIEESPQHISLLVQTVFDIVHNATLSNSRKGMNIVVDYERYFEYQGLYKIWSLAKQCRRPEDCILLYFHSKSMYNEYSIGKSARTIHNKLLTYTVVEDWRFVLEQFKLNKNLSTIGLAGGCLNPIQYFNFFWARGDYILTVGEPIKIYDRHWYEYKFLGNSTFRRENDVGNLCELKYSRMPNFKYPYNCTADDEHSVNYALHCFQAIIKYLPKKLKNS